VKRALQLVGLLIACVTFVFWFRVLLGNRGDYVEVPRSAGYREYVEGQNQTRFHFLIMSDPRGVVFDVFRRQLPPEKAPGPPGSDETQRWLKPRAERTAAAYFRLLGFEKGVDHRHGQYPNEPLYFFGVDYYFAVPHLLVVVLGVLPTLCGLRRY
jgi:hypothetical protein